MILWILQVDNTNIFLVVGTDLTIPISNGRLATGTWQGIYLLEFRDYQHTRNVVATINGQK